MIVNNEIIVISNSPNIIGDVERVGIEYLKNNKLQEMIKHYSFDFRGVQDALNHIKEEDINVLAVIASSDLEFKIKKLHEGLDERGFAPFPSNERDVFIDLEIESFYSHFPHPQIMQFYEELKRKFPEAENAYVSSYKSSLMDSVVSLGKRFATSWTHSASRNPFQDSNVIYYPFTGGSIYENAVCSFVLKIINQYSAGE